MKNKLILAGCSVSDYSNEFDFNYGELLASQLGYEYVHRAAGCGSNFRIWRLITSMIRNNQISENDILIIQYTTVERKEFFTSYGVSDDCNPNSKITCLKEPYDDGATIKFKIDSYKFYRNKNERNFLKTIEEEFLSSKYDYEVFLNNQLMFQCLLNQKKIKTIFLRQTYYQPIEIPIINFDKQIYISIDQFFVKGLCLEEGTPRYGHLNENGHEKLAEYLFKVIKDNNFDL